MLRCRTLFVWLLLSAAVPAGAQAVLILPFENRTRVSSLDWIGESAAEAMAARWRSPERYAIRREERMAALDQLGLPPTLGMSHATVIKIAEVTGADYVITGSYEGDAKNITFSARLLQMSPLQMGAMCQEAGDPAELLPLQNRLAETLAKTAGQTLASNRSLGTASREAWENYIRGLQAGTSASQVKFFREAVRLDPGFLAAAFQMGRLTFQSKEYPAAISWLDKLGRDDAHFLEARFLTGLCRYHLREWDKAEAAFLEVAAILPLNEAYSNLGAAQSRQKKRAAVESLQKAVEGDPHDPDYSFNLGCYYLRTGDYAQAARRFREALTKKPGDPDAKALLAAAVAETPSNEVAERLKHNFEEPNFRQLRMALERAAEDKLGALPDREHLESHMQRGRDFYTRGEDSAAITEFREVIKLRPGDTQAFLFLARLYLRGGRTEEAVGAARRAAEVAKKDPEPLLLLARIYWDQGKAGEAQDALREALDRDPNNSAARELERVMKVKP